MLLRKYGSDFTMIATEMTKTRDQIKRKFKVLEKKSDEVVDCVFACNKYLPRQTHYLVFGNNLIYEKKTSNNKNFLVFLQPKIRLLSVKHSKKMAILLLLTIFNLLKFWFEKNWMPTQKKINKEKWECFLHSISPCKRITKNHQIFICVVSITKESQRTLA